MTGAELKKIIQQGETSKVQFKELLDNQNSIAAEMIAFANTKGGLLLFGVKDKTGEITGLDYVQLQSTGNRLAVIASDFVFPEVYITTETVEVDGRNVLCVEVQEGTNKPYKDKNGTIWTKQGGDKRRVLDNHEQLRLFQQSKVIFVDEMTVPETSIEDINEDKISDYLRRINAKNLDLPKDILLKNMNVLKDGKLTIGGLLFFAKNPQQFRPTFSIKAVAFYGNDIAGKEYRDSRDINGTIPEMFYEAIGFFKTN
ncbi:MAG: putative DNA binding domain-containing protein, partial [Bacteroidales bacterium]|nr:putative DNA binding domain-containing protein [Bacteroidales bacterium]